MAVKSEVKCGISRRRCSQNTTIRVKEERNASYKKVSSILQKDEKERTDDDKEVLHCYSELVKEIHSREARRQQIKARMEEIEDPPDIIDSKCDTLARAVAESNNLVIYTGAGISTAARIPDYRGSKGIWTLLQQGKDIGLHDLSQAEPTFTHMALSELYRVGILKHIVSQNCDGLHLRSGLPKIAISEVHGNMYIEVCRACKPTREYLRSFDVTEHTARFSHKTGRRCRECHGPLIDTIVHFGERGTLSWPLNWSGACKAAEGADTILCLGSSLKVLKRYPWLWAMDKPAKKRPKVYIVNLQWTPKDEQAVLKIHGKCDEVMKRVMSRLRLNISEYIRQYDPIFSHHTPLMAAEEHTTSQPTLRLPGGTYSEPEQDVAHDLSIKKEIKTEETSDDNIAKQENNSQSNLLKDCVIKIVHTESVNNPPPRANTSNVFIGSDVLVFEPDAAFISKIQPLPTFRPYLPPDQFITPNLGPPAARIRTNVRAVPDCAHCLQSTQCNFYPRQRPGFVSSAIVCECCDDSDNEEEDNKEDIKDNNDIKEETKVEEEESKPNTINPGWYGKGYGKRFRKKR